MLSDYASVLLGSRVASIVALNVAAGISNRSQDWTLLNMPNTLVKSPTGAGASDQELSPWDGVQCGHPRSRFAMYT